MVAGGFGEDLGVAEWIVRRRVRMVVAWVLLVCVCEFDAAWRRGVEVGGKRGKGRGE